MHERRSWDQDAFVCAKRCLDAARKADDRETRRALERAGLKYLYRAHGKDLAAPGAGLAGARQTRVPAAFRGCQ